MKLTTNEGYLSPSGFCLVFFIGLSIGLICCKLYVPQTETWSVYASKHTCEYVSSSYYQSGKFKKVRDTYKCIDNGAEVWHDVVDDYIL